MKFNNRLAILVIVLTFAYAFASSALGWTNNVVMLALGVFLGQSGQIVTFYYRKAPAAALPPSVPPAASSAGPQ